MGVPNQCLWRICILWQLNFHHPGVKLIIASELQPILASPYHQCSLQSPGLIYWDTKSVCLFTQCYLLLQIALQKGSLTFCNAAFREWEHICFWNHLKASSTPFWLLHWNMDILWEWGKIPGRQRRKQVLWVGSVGNDRVKLGVL